MRKPDSDFNLANTTERIKSIMSLLKNKEKQMFEELFGMNTGNVLDFTNNTLSAFVKDEINVDIYNDDGYKEYCSKANKLRQIWRDETDYKVALLMIAMLDYYEDYLLKNNITDPHKKNRIAYLKNKCIELKENAEITISLPNIDNQSLKSLLEDIDLSLKHNKPESVLDRLHTYATKYLRFVCTNNSIEIMDDQGKHYPLPNLIGSLRRVYEKDPEIKTRFSLIAMKSSISLFEQFNDVRNSYSYAHDNEDLYYCEAKYIVKIVAETLMFIDGIEKNRTKDIRR